MSNINTSDIRIGANQSNTRERPRTSKQPAHQPTDAERSSKPTEERKSSNRASVLPQQSTSQKRSSTSVKPMEQAVHDAIIDLYLQVKIRSNEEVSLLILTLED